jgi:hypothetical protein
VNKRVKDRPHKSRGGGGADFRKPYVLYGIYCCIRMN